MQRKRTGTGGGARFNGNKIVTSEDLLYLIKNLEDVRKYWKNISKPFKGVLITAYYNKIVAKSNRITGLLKGQNTSKAAVGAKYNDKKTKHIITYLVDLDHVEESISNLKIVKEILDEKFNGKINKTIFEDKNIDIKFNVDSKITISKFKAIIGDVSYLDSFGIEIGKKNNDENIISFYDVDMKLKDLFKELDIDVLESKIYDNSTAFLSSEDIDKIYEVAPYLVAMSVSDINKIELDYENKIRINENKIVQLPNPKNEPIIGVIDTLFNTNAYFSNWVEYKELLPVEIKRNSEDYVHGTEVSSIIVDGPRLNPELEDGCGRFKVRHFGVTGISQFSSFNLIKQIEKIVKENKDIKVWNISLGSKSEIRDNFISFEASVLDRIQYENDCIFIISGTNKCKADGGKDKKIGSPADSINGLVVNSVTFNNKPAEYTRKGPVLSFYAKPDISYYGGSSQKYMKVFDGLGERLVAGTSFAAPWIARKMAYLIHIINLNKELAKALIIDSAKGWNKNLPTSQTTSLGYGIVPIHINEILKTPNDEIKFLITDVSKKYNTYNYHFPIPLDKNGCYPFNVKAVMCYTTKCDRSQGVDYSNTELNLQFGRIKDNWKISSINGDKQNKENNDEESLNYLQEKYVREFYRKWDNVKIISNTDSPRSRAKMSYTNKNWGMEIKTNNRLDPKDGENIRFGIVVTLKEINGENRIEEFIQMFDSEHWLVTEIENNVQVEFYEKIKEEIELQ
ncbi:S8 family peptidase [Mycoplasma sp. VS30B]